MSLLTDLPGVQPQATLIILNGALRFGRPELMITGHKRPHGPDAKNLQISPLYSDDVFDSVHRRLGI